jgi:hypothetical protein
MMNQALPFSAIAFFEQLQQRCAEVNSYLCVGLDPHPSELLLGENHLSDEVSEISEEERCNATFEYCKRIIDASGKHNNLT